MSNKTFFAEAIAGQSEGDRFIRSLGNCISPDALANKLIELMAFDGPGSPKLRGIARAIQKRLERRQKSPSEVFNEQ